MSLFKDDATTQPWKATNKRIICSTFGDRIHGLLSVRLLLCKTWYYYLFFFGMGICNGHGMEIEEPPYLNEAEYSSRKRHLSGRISPSKESPFHTHSTRLPVLFTFYCSALNKVGFIISCFVDELLPKPK